MLTRLANIFRVPDLRNKVVFTLVVIGIYQLGANIPVPGVSYEQIQLLQSQAGSKGVLGFLNLFSGGALTRLAIFGSWGHALHYKFNHYSTSDNGDP